MSDDEVGAPAPAHPPKSHAPPAAIARRRLPVLVFVLLGIAGVSLIAVLLLSARPARLVVEVAPVTPAPPTTGMSK